jgi:hypothetical protein
MTFNIEDVRLAAKAFNEVAEWPDLRKLALRPPIRIRHSSSPRSTGPWLKQRMVLDGSTTQSPLGSSDGDRPQDEGRHQGLEEPAHHKAEEALRLEIPARQAEPPEGPA